MTPLRNSLAGLTWKSISRKCTLTDKGSVTNAVQNERNFNEGPTANEHKTKVASGRRVDAAGPHLYCTSPRSALIRY
jgi:hypothetical protein